MGDRLPGVLGIDPVLAGEGVGGVVVPGLAQELNPVTGLDVPIPLTTDRIITAATRDWYPPQPRTMPEIAVSGRTLAEVAEALNRLPEWGEGGGMLRTDRIAVGTSTSVTVHVMRIW